MKKKILIVLLITILINFFTMNVNAAQVEGAYGSGKETSNYKNGETLTLDNPKCRSLLGDPDDSIAPSPAFMIVTALKVIKYVAIIILVVFSTTDLISSISSQDKDSLKKSVEKLIKRLVVCVVIFILPTLVNLIFNILHKQTCVAALLIFKGVL